MPYCTITRRPHLSLLLETYGTKPSINPIQQNGTVQHVLAGAPYGMVDEVSMPVKKWLTRTFVMARQGEFCQMYRG